MSRQEANTQVQSTGGTTPNSSNSRRRIVYLKDQPDARLTGGMCPSISCPGHCACVSKTK